MEENREADWDGRIRIVRRQRNVQQTLFQKGVSCTWTRSMVHAIVGA